MEEQTRKRGRPRTNFRPPILTEQQVEALQTPEQIAAAEARERERLRGIARRAEAKARELISQAETIQDFWVESRKLADPAKLAEWQARHEYVDALLADIYTVLDGREPDEEYIQDVADEISEDIAAHGVAGVTVPLLIGKFWQKPELLQELTAGDTPSAVFAKFGYMLAIADYILHRWNAYIASRNATRNAASTATTTGNGFVVMKCAGCNSVTGEESVQESIAARYAELKIPFRCGRCRDLERQSRSGSTLYEGRTPYQGDSHGI